MRCYTWCILFQVNCLVTWYYSSCILFFIENEQINLESFEVADPEEVVVRALEMLRIFKYTPPTTVDPYAYLVSYHNLSVTFLSLLFSHVWWGFTFYSIPLSTFTSTHTYVHAAHKLIWTQGHNTGILSSEQNFFLLLLPLNHAHHHGQCYFSCVAK